MKNYDSLPEKGGIQDQDGLTFEIFSLFQNAKDRVHRDFNK